jgi:hypothetical protein
MTNETEAIVTSSQLDDANMFNVAGPITINYSTTSIAGVPLFSYKDSELDLSFQGAEITRTQAAIGELVTVTLEVAVDAFIRTFTLLVPGTRLKMGDQISFTTIGIETVDRSTAFLPTGSGGALQTYRSHQLAGVAELVAF